MLRRCLLALSALSLLLASACQQPATQPAAKTAQARIANAESANIPAPTGNFDYYLFTLSWSPEYCHGHPNARSVVAIIRDLSCMACGRSSTMVNGPRPVPASLDYRIPPACSTSCPTPVSSSMSGPRTAPAPASPRINISASSAKPGTPSRFRHRWPVPAAPPPAAPIRSSKCLSTPIPECLPTILPSAVTIAIFPPSNFASPKICSPLPARPCATAPPTPSGFPRPIGPSALQSVATSARLEFPESRTPVFNASSLPIPARPIVSTVR